MEGHSQGNSPQVSFPGSANRSGINIGLGDGINLNSHFLNNFRKEKENDEEHKRAVMEEAKKRLLQLIMFVIFVTLFTISSVYLRHLHNGEAYFLKARVEDLICRPATHTGFNNGEHVLHAKYV
jgi:hypothetical protein